MAEPAFAEPATDQVRAAAGAADGLPASWLGRARRNARLYWLLQRAALRSGMQYRLNVAIMVLGGAAYQGSGLAFLWVLLHTVPRLAGWNFGQIAFLYGLRLLAHGVWLLLLNGITVTDAVVRAGEFERVLLRPVNPLLQMAPNPRSLMPLGDFSIAVVVFGASLTLVHIDWTPATIAVCLLGLLGGILIESAVALFLAGVSIRVVNLWAVRWFVDDSISMLSSYPLGIFSTGAQRLLTYLLPVAFIAYLPSSVVLHRTGQLAVPTVLAYLGPLVGAVMFAVAYLFWGRQLRHYQGVGH